MTPGVKKQLTPYPSPRGFTVVPSHFFRRSVGGLRGGDGLPAESTTLSGAQMRRLTTNNSLGLLDNLLTLGQDELDVARVRHVGVDLGNC